MIEMQVDRKQLADLINKLSSVTKDDVLSDGLERAGWDIASWVKRNRLSGPRPKYLGVKTNFLRASISSSKAEKSGDTYQVRVGTPAVYGPYHEFGFRGMVHVREHTRRQFSMASVFRIKGDAYAYKARKKYQSGYSIVEPYGYMRNYEGRPFLRPAIEDEENKKNTILIIANRIRKELEKKS